MVSEMTDRKTNTIRSHLYVEMKKAESTEIESRIVVARGWESGKWELLVKEYKLPTIRWKSKVQYGDYS